MIQHLANSIHFISLYKNINSEDIIYIKIKDKELLTQSVPASIGALAPVVREHKEE
jgi:hypothetical protein